VFVTDLITTVYLPAQPGDASSVHRPPAPTRRTLPPGLSM
jgi:hypothetical protein